MNTEEPTPTFKVGNLVTFNQDIYPSLGTWFVQLWEGEDVAARVYGDNHEMLNRRIAMLNTAQPQQEPVACERCIELERLCDATYVAQGADAYNHACSEMERWQHQRSEAGKEVGTTGSLCDGISWLYEYVNKLEAKIAAPQPPQRTLPQFPTALRKMWSGTEVQDWINANWNSIQQTKEPS